MDNKASTQDLSAGKPRRADFKTDDDFGVAYGNWMLQQSQPAARRLQPKPALPTAKTLPVAPATPVRTPSKLSARAEAQREILNRDTKAGFRGGKTTR